MLVTVEAAVVVVEAAVVTVEAAVAVVVAASGAAFSHCNVGPARSKATEAIDCQTRTIPRPGGRARQSEAVVACVHRLTPFATSEASDLFNKTMPPTTNSYSSISQVQPSQAEHRLSNGLVGYTLVLQGSGRTVHTRRF